MRITRRSYGRSAHTCASQTRFTEPTNFFLSKGIQALFRADWGGARSNSRVCSAAICSVYPFASTFHVLAGFRNQESQSFTQSFHGVVGLFQISKKEDLVGTWRVRFGFGTVGNAYATNHVTGVASECVVVICDVTYNSPPEYYCHSS